ncbi:MAG TPA: hypothetical protein VEG68_11450, partial [Terriglobales bacterium]|nr:hypothetical protein [Terriglobales bacterium]
MLKTQAGLDDFVTEKYADEIAAIFANWSTGLLQASQDVQAIEKVLASNFSGVSLRPADSKLVRSGLIEVRQSKFTNQTALGRDQFLQELRSAMSGFSQVF